MPTKGAYTRYEKDFWAKNSQKTATGWQIRGLCDAVYRNDPVVPDRVERGGKCAAKHKWAEQCR